jgi:hypothetical protein
VRAGEKIMEMEGMVKTTNNIWPTHFKTIREITFRRKQHFPRKK